MVYLQLVEAGFGLRCLTELLVARNEYTSSSNTPGSNLADLVANYSKQHIGQLYKVLLFGITWTGHANGTAYLGSEGLLVGTIEEELDLVNPFIPVEESSVKNHRPTLGVPKLSKADQHELMER